MFVINKLQQARIGLVVSMCILLLILYIVSSINFKNRQASQRALHSSDIIHKIDEISTDVNRLESTQRGYLLTRDSAFSLTLPVLRSKVLGHLAILGQLVKGDTVQSGNVRVLGTLINKRINYLDANLHHRDLSRDFVLKGNSMMNRALIQLHVLKDYETTVMDRKSKETLEWGNKSTNAVIIAVLIAAVLILIAYFILLQEYTAKANIERKLLSFQKQLREKIEKLDMSNKELEQFAYVASHDLQEPLRKIMTFNDRIHQKFGHTLHPDVLEYMARITKSAARMRTLIDDLLAYSRAARSNIERVPVDLEPVIALVKDTYEVTIQNRGVKFVQTARLPVISGDKTQMMVLFQNLVSNAIKFTLPEVSPVVEILVTLVGNEELLNEIIPPAHATYYRISVKDNGIGFSEKDATRIFGIFQRLHGRSEYEGTGIGLTICEKIAGNHEGYIKAVSEPGKGSEFIVYLPVPASSQA
jgi:signal transduction histidine kinase